MQLLLDDNGRTIGPLRGEIFWSDPRRADAPFGIQFVDVTLEQGRQILSVLDSAAREGRALPAVSPRPIEEALVDSERIRSILKSVCVMRHQGLLRQPGRTLRVSLEYFDVETSRLHWRLEEPSARWGQAPHDIEVVGYNSAFRMRVPELEVRGDRLVTPIPRRLWRVRHRARRRVPAPAGLLARFHHPLWNELGAREREIQDVSSTGLSLLGSADDLAFPGLILQPLELLPEDGEPFLMRGEVRYVGKPRPDGQRVLGLQVTPQTPEDEARWMQLVSQALCPDTRAGEEWLEPLWQLLADTDYHQLAGDTPEDFERQRASFVDTSLRAAREPHLFCRRCGRRSGAWRPRCPRCAPGVMAGSCTSSPSARVPPCRRWPRGGSSASCTCAHWSTRRALPTSAGCSATSTRACPSSSASTCPTRASTPTRARPWCCPCTCGARGATSRVDCPRTASTSARPPPRRRRSSRARSPAPGPPATWRRWISRASVWR
ncbi:hypothetical protein ACN28S_64470 [Cystobacter fuscus]